MNRISLTAALAVLSLGLAGPATAQSCSSSQKDIVSTAVKAGSFKTLVTALQHTGLDSALQGEGPFTVFAPTDAAFAKLPEGTLETLLQPENKETLAAILKFHVVAGKLDSSHVIKRSFATSLQGQRIDISTHRGVRVDGAKVVQADIGCTNGVIHVIDSVILPTSDSILTTAANAGAFKTLAAAIKAAGLVQALEGGPFTVFAPTDDAFAKLPKGTIATLLKPENKHKLVKILKLHVVSETIYSDQALKAGQAKALEGSTLRIAVDEHGVARVGDAKLIKTDIEAANGVIHVIDTVLLPETRVSQSAPAQRRHF